MPVTTAPAASLVIDLRAIVISSLKVVVVICLNHDFPL